VTASTRGGARRPTILMIDNYDSFTWNLVQYLEEVGAEVEVVRNDAVDTDAIGARRPDALVISPGPGTPDDAGVALAAIRTFSGSLPILGVCLGHQAIAQAFGGRIMRAAQLMHGKTSRIRHDGRGLFAGVASPIEATRYHSLAVDPERVPAVLEVSATVADGTIMGLRHRRHPTEGVQFHPESVLTAAGKDLLRNFVGSAAVAGRRVAAG
jgi:anthranilate synthase/aminodeoxychorismate synthase-like glutamine amidotransferase